MDIKTHQSQHNDLVGLLFHWDVALSQHKSAKQNIVGYYSINTQDNIVGLLYMASGKTTIFIISTFAELNLFFACEGLLI